MKRPRIANKGFFIGLGIGALILAGILLSGTAWPPKRIVDMVVLGGSFPIVFLVSVLLTGLGKGAFETTAHAIVLSTYIMIVPALFGGIIYKYKDKWGKALTITLVAFILITIVGMFVGAGLGFVFEFGRYDEELEIALSKDDPEACKTVSPRIHDQCFTQYANARDDPELCIHIRIEDSVYNCVINLAQKSGEMSYCNVLENSQYFDRPAKPQCLLRVAFKPQEYSPPGNPENCFELERRQDDCLRGYIYEDRYDAFFEDVNVCDQAMNASVNDFCRHHVAINHNNTAECPESTKEKCVNYIARIRRDPSTCRDLPESDVCVADVNSFIEERGYTAVNSS